jgi:hypothetical protein
MLESAGRRSARDWIVDVAMFFLAAGIGIYILVETWRDHDGVEVLLDFVLGVAEGVALAGGQLEHGADARGDFVLRATLPWTPA